MAPARHTSRRGLAWRLVGVITGVTAIALALSAIVAVALVGRSVTQTSVNDVENQAEQLAEGISEVGESLARRAERGRPRQQDSDTAQTDREPTIAIARAAFAGLFADEAAGLYEINPDGTIGKALVRGAGFGARAIAGTGQDVVDVHEIDGTALQAGLTESGTTTFDGAQWAWAASATVAAGGQMAVVVASPIESPGLVGGGTLLIAGLVALILAAAVSVLLSRWLTRPVVELTDATAKIASGDYSSRVDDDRDDEIGDLAASFNEMADELSRSREAERSFLMLVSHDLRTPLTSIKGYAEAIGDGAASGERAVDAAGVIGAESARLERLVQDLLDLARFEAKEFRLHVEPVAVEVLLSDLAGAYAVRADEAGLLFTAEGGQLPPTATDPDRLAQIIRNLLENGLRYVPSGCALSLSWGITDRNTIRIQVADTGGGIAPDDLPHVFERLYMTKRYRGERQVGSGLGLAIVADLTDALGGQIQVASEVGVGTRFVLDLPVADPVAEVVIGDKGVNPEYANPASGGVGSMNADSWPTSSPASATRNAPKSPRASARGRSRS